MGSSFSTCLLACVLGAMVVGGCSSFSGADGEGPPDAASDGGDGSAPPTGDDAGGNDASADGVAPPKTNLLLNGDFESGCGGWTAFDGTLNETTSTVFAGAKACIVCQKDPVAGAIRATQSISRKPVPGERYTLRAEVHAVAGATSTDFNIDAFMKTYQGIDARDTQTSTGPKLGTGWEGTSVLMEIKASDADRLEVEIGTELLGPPAMPRCFVIDEAVLTVE